MGNLPENPGPGKKFGVRKIEIPLGAPENKKLKKRV
jgi:hypothetical protein